jgi:hypothetical protein
MGRPKKERAVDGREYVEIRSDKGLGSDFVFVEMRLNRGKLLSLLKAIDRQSEVTLPAYELNLLIKEAAQKSGAISVIRESPKDVLIEQSVDPQIQNS